MADYHASPSSFTLPTSGTQSVTFSLPAAPSGGFTTGTITRVFTDNIVWRVRFSTAGGSDPYNPTSTHQVGFAPDSGDGLTHTETVSLTSQQLADLTAAAGGTITCSLSHTAGSGSAPYSDLYLTLTPGAGPVSGAADLTGVGTTTATGTMKVPGAAGLVAAANLTPAAILKLPASGAATGVGLATGAGLVAPPPGTYWSPGYQASPTLPASALSESSGSELFVASSPGSAACTALINYGAPATIARLDWTDGTAHTYAGLWEYSTDNQTWTGLTMPAPPTPSGTFSWSEQSLVLGTPITAQFWRLSVLDAPGGDTSATAGIRQVVAQATGGGTVRPVGSYCTDATFSLSGHWYRYYGFPVGSPPFGLIPHRGAWLSLIYKTCKSPVRQANAFRAEGTYCSNGDLHVMSVQTDDSGAYLFAPTGSILAATLVYGQWIANPDYDPDADLSALTPEQYLRVINFIMDPASVDSYACCSFTGSASGTWTYPPGYAPEIPAGATTSINLYSQGGTISDASPVGSAYETPCGYAQIVGPIPRQSATGFQSWVVRSANVTDSHPLTGAFLFDIRDGGPSVPSGFNTYIIKNGKWYIVRNVSLTVTDTSGASDSLISFDGLLTSVDWPNLASISVTSTIPSCGFGDGYPSPDDPNIYGPIPNPLLTRGTRLWYLGSPLDSLRTGCVGGSYSTVVVLADCSDSPTEIRADVFNRTLGVAWINEAGALTTAVHRAPLANMGDSGTGWEANQVIETSGTTIAGYQYLPTGRAYLDYTRSSSSVYRTNDRQGAGPASAWSSSAFQAVVGAAAGSYTAQEAWRFFLSGGRWQYSYCRDNRGAWSGGVVASTSATGTTCGAAWIGTGYGLLYNRSGDSHAVFRFCQNPSSASAWSAAPEIDLGTTLRVAGLVRMPSGTLVGLLWDASTHRSRACRSRDRGATWELAPFSEIIPALTTIPALTHLEEAVICCWQTGEQPQFAVSLNEGDTWT